MQDSNTVDIKTEVIIAILLSVAFSLVCFVVIIIACCNGMSEGYTGQTLLIRRLSRFRSSDGQDNDIILVPSSLLSTNNRPTKEFEIEIEFDSPKQKTRSKTFRQQSQSYSVSTDNPRFTTTNVKKKKSKWSFLTNL